jgi:DNA-binding beta-propeller fold protein YncE
VRIAVTPDGRHVVYAAMHDRAVEIADTAARKVVGRVPLEAGSPLVSLDLSRDGELAYTSAEESGTVYVVDLAARKLVRKFRTAAGAHPDPVMEIPAAE